MANSTPSPNMGLVIPTVAVDPGPDWANNINASLLTVDQHNHSSGQGVQVNPAGLNINSDLPFGSNNATLLRSSRYASQSVALSNAADIGCVYVAGVDLYYNDVNGNQIRITQSGSVAGSSGTITGLPSGTASASYQSISQTFVFQSATNTPANLDGASLVLRNLTANSKGLTLSPPGAMGSNYTITLPSIPASTLFVTMDTSGNMGTSASIQPTQIATASIIGSQLANQTVTRTQEAPVGQQVSSSSGVFTTTSTSFVGVISVTITTTGRPVVIFLQSDGTNSGATNVGVVGISGAAITNYQLVRNSTVLFQNTIEVFTGSGSGNPQVFLPPSVISYIDVVSAGTYTYSLNQNVFSGHSGQTDRCVLVAYEL